MNKKLIATGLSMFMLTGILGGCNSNSPTSNEQKSVSQDSSSSTETVSLKVWCSQEDQEMTKKLVEDFKKVNPNNTYNIDFGVVSEADAKNEILKDPSAGADVFTFSSDQIAELQTAGAIYRVTKNKDAIIADNSENSIKACTVDGELYAYPSSSDTAFMYYDKSKYSEEDVTSLEKMMAKDLGSGVYNFGFDIDNGWFTSGLFFAAGCTLFGVDGTDDTKCDFNNEAGFKVGNYMLDLAKNPKLLNFEDDGVLLKQFENGTIGAAISGTWNSAPIAEYLGDNFGAVKLPTFNIDGKDIQMGSMANFKLFAVNSQTKSPAAAMQLAEFLTNKDSQKVRFEKRSFVPTSKELMNDDSIMSKNIPVAASAEQSQYATLQTSISQVGKFWGPIEAFGRGLIDGSITKENMQSKLDNLVSSVLTKLS